MKAKLRFALMVSTLAMLAVLIPASQSTRAAGPWYVAPAGSDGNDCLSPGAAHACATINGALNKPGFIAGDTILVATGVYTGTGTEVVLINKNVVLSGGWDAGFTTQSGTSTIDGEGARRGITANWSVTATIERFAVQNAYGYGGGIYNAATLTLNNCAVGGNTGRGIYNVQSTLTLNNSTVSGNTVNAEGGGIFNESGTLTLNNSTVSGNTATSGGGIYSTGGGLTLNNSTVSGNTANSTGGGIYSSGAATLQNSLLSENTAGSALDCSGAIGSAGYNLVGNTTGCTFSASTGDLTNVNAHLGSLIGSPGYHPLLSGSPAINAGNPAGCTGSTGPLTTDQRGAARVGRCDIGAYEYTIPGPAASIGAVGGTPQHAPPLSAFGKSLQVAVLDGIGSPVNNSTVTFSAPASGASGTFSNTGTFTTTAVTNESGIATAATFTANGQRGSYVVTATVSGVITQASFSLSNILWYAAPGGNDGNDCLSSTTACATINGALNKPGFVAGDTILAATGVYTDTGTEVVLINKSVTLSGGWDAGFTAQSGTSTINGQGARQGMTVNSDVTAVVERLTIQNCSSGSGGGIYNAGTLTLNNSTVSSNTSGGEGGGIRNYGTMTLNDSGVTNNIASGDGGGIYSWGILTLNNSTVSNNIATGYSGGGIYSWDTLTLNNSTVSNNTVSNNGASANGGGIYSQSDLILNNSTVSNNGASTNGGGIYSRSTLTLNSSTVSNNTANDSGGGIYGIYDSFRLLQNSILAGNTASNGPDCSGTVSSAGYNLVGNTSDCTFTPGSGDLTNVNAGLGPLIGAPGQSKYHPLLSGSPAIDAGNPTGCTGSSGPLTTDQRGVARVGRCDIGAYEYTTPGPAAVIYAFAGTPQHAAPLDMYMMPLQAAVLDSLGSPVSDTIVLFSAPTSGASGTFTDTGTYTTSATTAEGGVATAATFTANGLSGNFTVMATVEGVVTPANFLVGNLAWYVAVGGNENNDCLSPATVCASINSALGKPGIGLVAGDTVRVATGVYTGTDTEVVLLNKNVTLSGGWDAGFTSHSGTSTIDGEGTRRGMTVNSDVTAVVERLTIQNCSSGSGGGIYNAGTLTLSNSTVSRNMSGSEGGGIRNYGTMILNDSSVSNNTASGIGGGTYNAGTLTLNNTAITNNTANHDGGGIYNGGNALTLNNSTISGNTAPNPDGQYGLGGGIYSSGGVLILNNL